MTNPSEKYPPLTNVLHIYPQPLWHFPVYIVGDGRALINLYSALGRAVLGKKIVSEAFTNDGEGYNVVIRQVTADEMSCMAVPYTDECAAEKNEGATWPGRGK